MFLSKKTQVSTQIDVGEEFLERFWKFGAEGKVLWLQR